MIKRIHTLLLAATMLAASSCITDEIETGGPDTPVQDGNEVLLRLKTPCNFTAPKTRALTYAQENTIEDIYVLVFDTDGELAGIEKGDDVDDKTSGDGAMTQPEGGYSGGGTFSVTLSQAGDNKQYKLVVLANAEAILEGRGFIDATTHEFKTAHTGDSYTDVAAGLYGGFAAKYAAVTIPMWGETGQTLISPRVAIPTINMRRALARIDVGLGLHTVGEDGNSSWNGKKGSTDIDFSLTCVYVMMPNDQYALIPDPTKASTVPSPAGSRYTVITESNAFKYTEITDTHYTTRSIYVPEADLKNASNAQRMAIVVGGSYNGGDITYYRLDFADGNKNPVDVLRNHLYRFNILSVDGPGYPSVKEAYEALSMNITADTEIEEESSDFGNIVFDDNYYIAYDPGEFTFKATPDGTQTLNIETNYTTWTAKVGDAAGNAISTNWLTLSASSGTTGLSTIMLTAQENADYINDRTAYIHITAGRITLKVEVTQEEKPLWGGHADILYFDESDDNRLSIGRWGDGNVTVENMVFTQFGSVVGFIIGPAWDTENSVKFSPTGGTSYGYTSISNYSKPSTVANSPSVSSPLYHNYANLKLGRGDICKLVGLTSAEAKVMADAGTLHSYTGNDGWRLPTMEENRKFIGNLPDDRTKRDNTSGYYDTSQGSFSADTALPVENPGLATFPRNIYQPGVTLPAAGRRGSNGAVADQGYSGYYWSSTPAMGNGYELTFGRLDVTPSDNFIHTQGFAIRCVRDE